MPVERVAWALAKSTFSTGVRCLCPLPCIAAVTAVPYKYKYKYKFHPPSPAHGNVLPNPARPAP
jgi:hypothetical protein